jgi:ADP-ribose pyrophosphatase YjhB (NUDIX family)
MKAYPTVFIRTKAVIFTGNRVVSMKGKGRQLHEYAGMKELLAAFGEFIKSEDKTTLYIHSKADHDKLFRAFISQFTLTLAAGGAVINNKGEVLMIRRHGRWDLPKGKKNKTEKKKEAAIREVAEETGIANPEIRRKIQTTYHFYRRNGRLYIKKTSWYLMQAAASASLIPARKEGISTVKWFPLDKACKKRRESYRSVAEVMKKAIRKGMTG